MGNVFALKTLKPQYETGITRYNINTYPTKTFAMAKNGQTSGLNKNEATVVQSRVKAPSPSPLRPDPIWWAVTELGKAQQTQEMLCRVWKRYPGNTYQQKLQINAITKNCALDRRFLLPFSTSSFSCSVLQNYFIQLLF